MKTDLEKPLVDAQFLLQKYPGKGGWTYTVIPGELKSKKNPFGWGYKVKGKIDNYEFKNYNLFPIAGGNIFLPVKAEIRKKIGKQEGDLIHVILYPDNDPLEIPKDLLLCLLDDPIAHNTFLSYSEGEQKLFVDWINSAKREETKVDRIAKTLNKLVQGKKFYDKDL